MIFAATASFFLAVVLGLTLVVLGMRYRRGSLALAVAHVVAALVGLALLLRHIADSATQRLHNLSAFLFVLALLGGFVLLALRISKREYRTPPPMIVVFLHAAVGVFALLLLAVGTNNG